MQPEETLSQRPANQSGSLVAGRRRRGDLLRLSSVLVSVIHLVGCASTGLPTARERTAVGAGEKAIVLLRVECTIENEQPYEPFHYSLTDENLSFGLGSFETGGQPKHMETLRFLSPESRRTGWTYFVLPYGTYYLAVYLPRRLETAHRWRIDVPEKAKLIYVGTLRLSGNSEPVFHIVGTVRMMSSLQSDRLTVADERELASKLMTEHFSQLDEVQTVLMQRQEGPIILRSPLPASTK